MKKIDERAINSIRFLSIDSINKANSGHPGLPMGAAPMAYTLFNKHININPENSKWFNDFLGTLPLGVWIRLVWGDGSLTAAPATGRIFSNNSDNPGTDSDYYYDNSWAVGINENGYIIGNRSYRLKESRNYPTKMFVAKYNSGSVSIVSSEIISTEGVDSEGAAINNKDRKSVV